MKLFVAVTVDIDNDGATMRDERNALAWRGLEFTDNLSRAMQDEKLPTTWFVRADPQICNCYGSAAFLLLEHRERWARFVACGDEIGWHPHIYAMRNGVYEPEPDHERVADALRATHRELTANGLAFASVRMGEAIGSNTIMRALAQLGLRIDSSAIPGRQRTDASRSFDWGPSPNCPYRPSRSDYRVAGSTALPILEVPMTAVPVHAPYDQSPLTRYANLAYHPPIFAAAFERWLDGGADGERDMVLTLITHPDEVMPAAHRHPLYAFDLDALRANLATVLTTARRRGFEVLGCTLSMLSKQVALEPSI